MYIINRRQKVKHVYKKILYSKTIIIYDVCNCAFMCIIDKDLHIDTRLSQKFKKKEYRSQKKTLLSIFYLHFFLSQNNIYVCDSFVWKFGKAFFEPR